MKKCPKCGAELTEDVRYCPFCGAPVGFTEEVNNTAEEAAEAAEEAAEEVKEEAEEKKAEAEEKKSEFEEKAREAADEVKEAAAKIGAAAKEGWDKLNDKYGDKAKEAGAKAKEAAKEAGGKAKEGFEKVMDTPDSTEEFDPADIEANKVLSLFAYIGILFIIPLIAAKDSKYARFHTNQGIVLFIFAAAFYFLSNMKWFGWIFGPLELIAFAFGILGIINAVTGKAKELPLIGKIRILE